MYVCMYVCMYVFIENLRIMLALATTLSTRGDLADLSQKGLCIYECTFADIYSCLVACQLIIFTNNI